MKTCPQCAEQVQNEANLCRYCGHKFGFHIPKIGCGGILALVFLIAVLTLGREGDKQPASPMQVFSPAEIKQCANLISKAERQGLIRERPTNTRINVEDQLWLALPATAKRGIMSSLACEAYGGRQLQTMDFVVAYGYRSGRRVAMFSPLGLTD